MKIQNEPIDWHLSIGHETNKRIKSAIVLHACITWRNSTNRLIIKCNILK